jgi:hypothetical protein
MGGIGPGTHRFFLYKTGETTWNWTIDNTLFAQTTLGSYSGAFDSATFQLESYDSSASTSIFEPVTIMQTNQDGTYWVAWVPNGGWSMSPSPPMFGYYVDNADAYYDEN